MNHVAIPTTENLLDTTFKMERLIYSYKKEMIRILFLKQNLQQQFK